MEALPPGVSDLHCPLRLYAKIYHLLKRHDCILNRAHRGMEGHTLSASFHSHGCLDIRIAGLRDVFIPSTICLERAGINMQEQDKRNVLLKQCRNGELAEISLNRTENISQAVLFQVLYLKYFLIFANGL